MQDNNQPIGIINEVGDLGLGCDELSENDKEKLNKEKERK